MNFNNLTFSQKGKIYKRDTFIFKEHAIGMEMYFIEFGEVGIVKKIGAVEVKLDMLDRGKFFGEMSLITGRKRVASAKAITDCKVHTMNKVMFEKNLVNNKVFMKKIIETLAFRLEETNIKLKDHALKVFRLLESRNIIV